uniref:MARVEL domain-containing protein n=1 Tax=Caenorhabditis tropicalis TaxID=1561998 RepID=A0A1I7UJD7_9PELO
MDSFKRLQSKVFTSVTSLRKTDESADEQAYNTKRCFIHVNHLSIAIAVVELSILIYQLVNGSWGNSEHSTVFTIAALLFLVVIGLLFVAIFYEIGNLLIPHILMQILLVLCFLGLTFATLYALFHGATFQLLVVVTNPQIAADSMTLLPAPMISTNVVSGFLVGLLVIFAVVYLLIAVLNTWCMYVVIDSYQLLKGQKSSQTRAPSVEEYCAPKTIQLSLYPNQIVQATDF